MTKSRIEITRVDNPSLIEVAAQGQQLAWQDFKLVLLGAVALLALVAVGEQVVILQPLRIILGLAFVLCVPGYCLTAVLFPRLDAVGVVERIGLSIGFSCALISILALVLDWLPWGLQLWPILLGEYGLILLLVILALWRRARLPLGTVGAPAINWQPLPWWLSLPSVERRLFALLAVVLILISLALAGVFLVPSSDEFMTEFYVLGNQGQANNYPYEVGAADEVSVTVGVVNQEKRKFNYWFEVWVVDSRNPDRRALATRSDSFPLLPGQKYQRSVSWSMPWAGDNQVVELLLFHDNDPTPMRQLRIWLNVRGNS